MVEARTRKESDIDLFRYGARKLADATISPRVFKSELTDSGRSIDKAREALGNNKGVIFIINHLSERDPAQIVREIFHDKGMGRKKIIAPIAVHHDHLWLHAAGKLLGVTLKPIVTENTRKEQRYRDRKLNEGKAEYSTESIEGLKKGRIVVLAPQGERMPKLGHPQFKNLVIGTLMALAKKNKLDNYAFLFIGIGIKGVDDYSDGKRIKGFNPSDVYTLNIGTFLTNEDVLAQATRLATETAVISKKPENPLRFVDQVIFEELRKVVPDAYK